MDHVVFFLDHLRGGGIQKVWVTLANNLAERGYLISLAVCEQNGILRRQISGKVNLVPLKSNSLGLLVDSKARSISLRGIATSLYLVAGWWLSRTLPFVQDFSAYLRSNPPAVVVSASPYMNIDADLAIQIAGVRPHLVVSEHNHLTPGHPLNSGLARRLLPALLRGTYARAGAIVAVSEGVAADMVRRTGLPRERITTIYNPAVPPDIDALMTEPIDHPWFAAGAPPVVLGVGRLGTGKDFSTLVTAFALARQHRPMRLVILGGRGSPKKTAKRQAHLMDVARKLGVADDIWLPGFVENPYAFMARSGVFVLSSVREGFGNALAEALACGCPAVSTDCPSGPAEILDHGRYGILVPVRDVERMADAIVRTLATPRDPAVLRARAQMFSVPRSVDHWEMMLRPPGMNQPAAIASSSA